MYLFAVIHAKRVLSLLLSPNPAFNWLCSIKLHHVFAVNDQGWPTSWNIGLGANNVNYHRTKIRNELDLYIIFAYYSPSQLIVK